MGVHSTREQMKRMSMQYDVETFMRMCGQEVKTHPQAPDAQTVALRKELIYEEVMGLGELFDSMDKGNLAGIADGIADVLYVVLGTAAAYGIDAQACFDEAHRSNMTKATWDERTRTFVVIKSETGKILKPDTFVPADFSKVIKELEAPR